MMESSSVAHQPPPEPITILLDDDDDDDAKDDNNDNDVRACEEFICLICELHFPNRTILEEHEQQAHGSSSSFVVSFAKHSQKFDIPQPKLVHKTDDDVKIVTSVAAPKAAHLDRGARSSFKSKKAESEDSLKISDVKSLGESVSSQPVVISDEIDDGVVTIKTEGKSDIQEQSLATSPEPSPIPVTSSSSSDVQDFESERISMQNLETNKTIEIPASNSEITNHHPLYNGSVPYPVSVKPDPLEDPEVQGLPRPLFSQQQPQVPHVIQPNILGFGMVMKPGEGTRCLPGLTPPHLPAPPAWIHPGLMPPEAQPFTSLEHFSVSKTPQVGRAAMNNMLPTMNEGWIDDGKPAIIVQCFYPSCGEILSPRRPDYIKHRRAHRPLSICPLDGCGMHFADESFLRKHIMEYHALLHSEAKALFARICTVCGMVMKGSMKQHRANCLGYVRFVCTYRGCTGVFVNTMAAWEHIKCTHEDNPLYGCWTAGCQQRFSRREEMFAHYNEEHHVNMPGPVSLYGTPDQQQGSTTLVAGDMVKPGNSENDNSDEVNPRKRARIDSEIPIPEPPCSDVSKLLDNRDSPSQSVSSPSQSEASNSQALDLNPPVSLASYEDPSCSNDPTYEQQSETWSETPKEEYIDEVLPVVAVCYHPGCRRQFSFRSPEYRHHRWAHPPPFTCPMINCDQGFTEGFDYLIEKHMVECHLIHKPDDRALYGNACRACGMILQDFQFLVLHEKNCIGYMRLFCTYPGCDKLAPFVIPGRMTEHIYLYHKITSSRFACTTEGCGKRFYTSKGLYNHQKVHTGDRPYRCTHEGCTKAYKQMSHLHRHLQNHENTVKKSEPGQCPFCHRVFKAKPTVIYHIRYICGSNTLNFKKDHCVCVWCGQVFVNRKSCSKHVSTCSKQLNIDLDPTEQPQIGSMESNGNSSGPPADMIPVTVGAYNMESVELLGNSSEDDTECRYEVSLQSDGSKVNVTQHFEEQVKTKNLTEDIPSLVENSQDHFSLSLSLPGEFSDTVISIAKDSDSDDEDEADWQVTLADEDEEDEIMENGSETQENTSTENVMDDGMAQDLSNDAKIIDSNENHLKETV